MSAATGGFPERVFRDWLQHPGLTGCSFAVHFAAAQDRLLFYEFVFDIDEATTQLAADILDQAGELDRVAILLFPKLRAPQEVCALIRALSSHPRWVARVDHAFARDEREVGLELTWTTSHGDTTSAMGFAPCGYMPLTRRSPFVAIAAWTGGHQNTHRKGAQHGFVSMGDAPPQMTTEQYEEKLTKTRDRATRLGADDVPAKVLRRLAFRLPRTAVEEELPDLVPPL